jgi:hypothetical protein
MTLVQVAAYDVEHVRPPRPLVEALPQSLNPYKPAPPTPRSRANSAPIMDAEVYIAEGLETDLS